MNITDINHRGLYLKNKGLANDSAVGVS